VIVHGFDAADVRRQIDILNRRDGAADCLELTCRLRYDALA
jgi:hypothetical protein